MTRALIITVTTILAACIFPASDAQGHPAWGVAADRQGRVYFSDLKTVWKIDAQGKLSAVGGGEKIHTHDLNVDEAGNVYGEVDFSAIWKMTPAGGFSYLFAPAENPPEGISIWRDRDGNMYSVRQNNHLKRETLLLRRTPGGDVSVLAGGGYGYADGKGGKAKFSNIVGMTFGPDGSLYLTDGPNVRRVKMDGTVTTLARNITTENASGSPASGSSLFGIAVDARGNAFVADYGNRRILKIAPDGQVTTLLRAEESWFPTGVAERGGELYVLEESHTPAYQPIGTRVRRLSPGGKVTVLATAGENRALSGNRPAGESSSGESAGRTAGPGRNPPYALIGAGMGAFALTIVWGVRRRMHDCRHENT